MGLKKEDAQYTYVFIVSMILMVTLFLWGLSLSFRPPAQPYTMENSEMVCYEGIVKTITSRTWCRLEYKEEN